MRAKNQIYKRIALFDFFNHRWLLHHTTTEGNLHIRVLLQIPEDIVTKVVEETIQIAEEPTKEEEKDDKKPQSKPFWQSETSMHYENLTAVAAAAQQDYRINGAKRGWMSKRDIYKIRKS